MITQDVLFFPVHLLETYDNGVMTTPKRCSVLSFVFTCLCMGTRYENLLFDIRGNSEGYGPFLIQHCN